MQVLKGATTDKGLGVQCLRNILAVRYLKTIAKGSKTSRKNPLNVERGLACSTVEVCGY